MVQNNTNYQEAKGQLFWWKAANIGLNMLVSGKLYVI